MLGQKRWGWLAARRNRRSAESGAWLVRLVSPLAQPPIAGLVALAVYLVRALLAPTRLGPTEFAYFNFLADAFLHGQLSLRLPTPRDVDLVFFAGRVYLYWPPFPAILVTPLVALFGVNVSDILYTLVVAAITVALLAYLLVILDKTGVAPLSAERRAILVATVAFGSVVLILAPIGAVWNTAQIIGWGCVLLATVAPLALRDKRGYLLAGLALACATATRTDLLCNGVWLAYYLLARDRRLPLRQRVAAAICGLAPVVTTLLLLGWYNAARFGHPLNMGLAWHHAGPWFRGDFERFGTFNFHYLPTNLYYHFVAPPLTTSQVGLGGGLFWMTPLLLGAPYAVWRGRNCGLVWALVASCALGYIPLGLVMGTGYLFGSRYLLDLMVPLVVLTAQGIRRWRLDVLQVLMIISLATFLLGSVLMLWWDVVRV
jgi:hypothetical protein